jgi:hypothetical protein
VTGSIPYRECKLMHLSELRDVHFRRTVIIFKDCKIIKSNHNRICIYSKLSGAAIAQSI